MAGNIATIRQIIVKDTWVFYTARLNNQTNVLRNRGPVQEISIATKYE